MDDRVGLRLHVNFIYHMKYSILHHYTLALESDYSLLPGQYFLVSRVDSVSFPCLYILRLSFMWPLCEKALFTDCLRK